MDDARIFLVALPGLEAALEAEVRRLGFAGVRPVPGGVEIAGDLQTAARANRALRTAVRVLWRVAEFRAMHLAQLDKRSRKLPWRDWLRVDVPVRVDATCRKSKIYHHKAAAQRVERAVTEAGIPLAPDAEIVVKLRIEDDLCTISIDTTGDALHKRGHKTFVGKAPLRETMAAAFLWHLGFDGSQTVMDPMCGSGTIPIEAAEIAAGLLPGRTREFAFEHLAAWQDTRDLPEDRLPPPTDAPQFFGYDRDQGAIAGAIENAKRTQILGPCVFERQALSDLHPPAGAPGIVLTNPPYGARIGNRKQLFGLYGSLGQLLRERFGGWTVGVVTSDGGLAKAMNLDLDAFGPVDHSGTKVTLWHGTL